MSTTTAETKYIAFHGKNSIKKKYVGRMRAHLEADQLIPGATGSGGKGCAVWCTFDKYDHSLFPKELGFPISLAYLNESIFEGSSKGEFQRTWPLRFLEAAAPGANLTFVPYRFTIWLFTSPDSLYEQVAKKDEEAREIFVTAAALYQRFVDGDKPSNSEWNAVIKRASEASDKAWASYNARARALDLALDRARALALALDLDLDRDLDRARARALDLRQKFLVLAAEKLLQLMADAPVVNKQELVNA